MSVENTNNRLQIIDQGYFVTTLIYFFVFILGAVIGSFLNVIIFRYGTGQFGLIQRSRCFSCSKILKWMELIPIVSYLWGKGRCFSCKSRISIQYIFVEVLTGLTFILIYLKTGPTFTDSGGFLTANTIPLLFYWVIFSLLIAIAVYDFRHKIIPNGLVYTFIILAFLKSIGIFDTDLWNGIFFGNYVLLNLNIIHSVLYALGAALPFFALWFFSGGAWMGFGDVKLALGIGLLLKIDFVYAILWAFWIGGIISLILLLLSPLSKIPINNLLLSSFSKRFTMKSEIPFGPFLILGIFIAYFFEWDFLNLNIIFSLI